MSDRVFIEKYWRKAKPEDSVKDPPMRARFRDGNHHSWVFGDLCNWDRSGYPWVDEVGDGYIEAEVYDAPPLVASYVPFTWDDVNEFFGRIVVIDGSRPRHFMACDAEVTEDGLLLVNDLSPAMLLDCAKFKDTGKPFGKEVFNEVG